MKEHLYFFYFLLHFSTGCIVSDVSQTIVVSGYSGGSVLLPCSCAQPQSTVHTFSWQFQHSVNGWISVFEDQKYSGRLVLFNESSPTNLSLLISDLRKTDEGYYKCLTERNTPTFVRLTVRGCHLTNNGKTGELTGYSGDLMVLPCSCTELLVKPEHIQWMYMTENGYKEIYPNETVESHKNRVKLFNQNPPGNLSLLISALTIKHQGDYYCSVSLQQIVSFVLTVKERPDVHPASSTTHGASDQTLPNTKPPAQQQTHHTLQYVFIPLGGCFSVMLMALLVFIYWRCRGGRNVKKETNDDEELKKEPVSRGNDDVMYSTVLHVKTDSTSHTQHHPEELTEYSSINVKW